MKDHLLKSLDYLYNLPPSKYTPLIITRFKWNLLPELMTFISASEDRSELDRPEIATPEKAEEIFGENIK